MEQNKVNSTILSEHRGVVASRYILSIINFIAILAGTLLTMYFVTRRGAPTSIMVHLYILLAINVVQIGVCIADYVLKQFCGRYVKAMPIVSYSVAGAWLLTLVSEIFFGTQAFGVLRIDIIGVAIIQLVVALIAYLVWPFMDRHAIDAMIRRSIRDDVKKRKKKANGAVLGYVTTCLLVIVAQIGTLFVYKIPPRLYDLFAETRALQYELSADGTGYVVTSMYTGTATSVNIPATYNNKPVIGIKSGALVDEGIVEQYRFTKITFGTPTTNENGEIETVSNLTYLEPNAIVSHKIQSLTLPASVVSIGDGAIVSDSLKELTYAAKADFSYSYLQCSAMEKIVMSGDNVGLIRSLDGMPSTTTIAVSKDIYNEYRKANFNYVKSFRPILSQNEYYVDFFTDCDYYIDSIFFNAGEAIQLKYSDLKNASASGVSPVTDTLAYIKNPKELGTEGAKANSAFRGWYYDENYANECVFTENGSVRIAESTALYAKWIDEYYADLIWGTYTPDGATKKMYWTDEDVATFPVVEGRTGYESGVTWKLDGSGETITTSTGVKENVTLQGTWNLDKPGIDVTAAFTGIVDNDFNGNDSNNVSFTYDEGNTLTLSATKEHPLNDRQYNGKRTEYTYSWKRTGNGNYNATNDAITLQNVADGDTYTLTVTVKSPYGETASDTSTITVNIKKKAIAMGDVNLADGTVTYNGGSQKLKYTGEPTSSNIACKYTYKKDGDGVTTSNGGVTNAGTYTVTATFEKNNADEAANYAETTKTATLTINPIALEFERWEDNGFTDDNKVTYDGSKHTYCMVVSGVLSGETAELVYYNGKDNGEENRTHEATNAGTYSAEVTGVNNSNYTLGDSVRRNGTKTWTIRKKAVTVDHWRFDNSDWSGTSVVYNGNVHSVFAVLDGVVGYDTVNCTYASDTFSNTGINANNYTAKVTGVDNANYTFDTESANAKFPWTITQRALNVSFEEIGSGTYDGSTQGVTATISNVVKSDWGKFSVDSFDLGTTNFAVTKTGTQFTSMALEFTAKNAGEYKAVIADLKASATGVYQNYTISATTEKTYTIAKKTLTFETPMTYTYNGTPQKLLVQVEGICGGDTLDRSVITFDKTVSFVDGNVVYTATDAGTYTLNGMAVDNSNYELASSSVSVTINKATLTITGWTAKQNGNPVDNLDYNAKAYTMVPTVTGVCGNDSVSLTLSGNSATNAGNYKATASLAETYSNYTLAAEKTTKEWTISPKTICITWKLDGLERSDGTEVTYDKQKHVMKPSYTLCNNSDTITLDITRDGTGTDARDYILLVSDEIGNSNYQLGQTEWTWKINKKTVTLSGNWVVDGGSNVNVSTLTYRNSPYTLTTSISSGVCEGDSVSLTYNGNERMDAGKYTAEVTGVSNSNYTLADNDAKASCDWKIEPKALTLAWGNTTFTYNGMSQSCCATYSTGAATASDGNAYKNDISFTYDGNSEKDAGTYTAKVTGVDNSNYKVTTNGSTSWTINKKEIESSDLTWINTALTYNGSLQRPTAKYKDLATGNLVEVNEYSTQGAKDASDTAYSIQITNLGNSNYAISGTLSHNYTIRKKTLTVSGWLVGNSVNSNNASLQPITYNGAAQTITARFGNVESGDTVNVTYQYNTVTDQGNYSFSMTGLDNTNYSLPAMTDYIITVKPKPVTLTWGTTVFTYDGNSHSLTATVTNACTGDSVNVTGYSGGVSNNYGSSAISDNEATNAGTYTVKATVVDNSNYTVTGGTNISKSLTINKARVTITWGKTTTFTYDGSTHSLEATVKGVNGNVDFTYNNNGKTNAGEYTVTIASLKDSNYTLNEANGSTSATLTINPKPVTLMWSETTFTYDGNSHSLTARADGIGEIVSGKTYSGDVSNNYGNSAISGNTATNAGEYTVMVTKLSSDNYTATNLTCSFTIQKVGATVAVVPGTQKLTYNGSAQTPTVKINGYEASSGIKYTIKNSKGESVTSAIDAGSYTYVLTGLDTSTAHNYILQTEGCTFGFEILPKKLTYNWNGGFSYTYSGKEQHPTATPDGSNLNNDITFTYKVLNRKTVAEEESVNVGDYRVVITGTGNPNYTVGTNNYRDFTITAKQLSVKWATTEKVYNGKSQTIGFSIQYGGNTIKFSDYTVTYTDASGNPVEEVIDAGTYTCTITSNNNNYELNDATKEFTITPLTLRFMSDPTYNDNVYELTINTNSLTSGETYGFVNGDDITVVFQWEIKLESGEWQAVENCTAVGQYKITATGITGDDAHNYRLSSYDANNYRTITKSNNVK